MKVYSKKEVNLLVSRSINDLKIEIMGECIRSVQDKINDIVSRRDLSDLVRLENRMTTLEIDNPVILRKPPISKNNKSRKIVLGKIDERIKT